MLGPKWYGNVGNSASSQQLSHFFFALGQVAIHQLVHIENTASTIRKQRLAKEKAALEAQSQGISVTSGKPQTFVEGNLFEGF